LQNKFLRFFYKSDLALKRSYINLAFTPMFKKGCDGNLVGLFLASIISISFVVSLLALIAICSPNKVPTPIPEPL